MPALTSRETKILAGLTPHTRAHAIFLLSRHPQLHLSSGRRTARRNKEVGGAIHSYHLRGRAVDFIGTLAELRLAETTARHSRVGARCTGPEEVLLEYPGEPRQHLHVAW